MSCVTITTVVRRCCSHARELASHFLARDRVERAERFIHEKDRRVRRQRTCQTHTLALASG